jgi:hypothetical protein
MSSHESSQPWRASFPFQGGDGFDRGGRRDNSISPLLRPIETLLGSSDFYQHRPNCLSSRTYSSRGHHKLPPSRRIFRFRDFHRVLGRGGNALPVGHRRSDGALFILLTSIPFVVVCSLLVRLVAPAIVQGCAAPLVLPHRCGSLCGRWLCASGVGCRQIAR